MVLHTLIEPKQWIAGYVGADHKPFYFGCAHCHTDNAIIAGCISSSESKDFNDVMAVKDTDGFYHPALYCASCWPGIKAKYNC